jgi:hypothetical protein
MGRCKISGANLTLVKIPCHRLVDPCLESPGRIPPEFLLSFRGLKCIAPIVTLPVGDEADQAGELIYRFASEFRQNGTEEMDDVQILPPILASNVVCLPHAPAAENKVNTGRVILYIQPVADVGAIAIYRDGPTFEARADNGGDELLCVLEGAVVVRTVGGGGQSVGVVIGSHQMIASRFACGIGRIRGIGSSLVARRIIGA